MAVLDLLLEAPLACSRTVGLVVHFGLALRLTALGQKNMSSDNRSDGRSTSERASMESARAIAYYLAAHLSRVVREVDQTMGVWRYRANPSVCSWH